MSVLNTNLKALAAQESMRASNLSMSQAMERLSTGKKINSAKDDAAGLAITNRMTNQIRGLSKAINNVNDAISMTQTAEGAFGNISEILQRMRELAVQAVNGTNTATDRSSINLEVAQLKSQIDTIANSTNHNNIKLLDGSAQNVLVQAGFNAGDTITMGFASAKTKDIGIGSKAFLQSTNGLYTAGSNFDALVSGSMLLNGVSVGASLAIDDNASYAATSASAIAKAAAVNRVSQLSGVYARAEGNTVSGSAMSASSGTAGTIVINGVSTDSFALSTSDLSLARKSVVTAINAKSAITGVTAIDTQDDNLGVQLVASDGRNISVYGSSSMTAAVTGLNFNMGSLATSAAATAQATFVGSYSLYTLDGRDVSVSVKDEDQNVENYSGLQTGTYKADTAIYNTYSRAAIAGAAPASATTGLLGSSALIINGVQIGAALNTDDTASDVSTATSSTRASSAIAIAAAINRSSSQTGVTAKAAANVVKSLAASSEFTATTTNATVYLNGVTFTVNTQTLNGVIDSFNAKANQTGVTASQAGSGLVLTAQDGRNIVLGTNATTAANIGLAGLSLGGVTAASAITTYVSSVTLQSDNAITIKSGLNGVTNLENLGFREGTFGASKNGLKINQVNTLTVSDASLAIGAIDAAINTISSQQANSGAINNRLDSIINNLNESSTNIQASRSRILDTDYATETTNLAKQQIIQQAATAMLAQANQSSQSILSLLK